MSPDLLDSVSLSVCRTLVERARHWKKDKVTIWRWDSDHEDSDANKSSQLRKFYDELVEWQENIGLDPNLFEERLPLVMMLKAKVAYAEGRNHVTPDFSQLLGTLLDQVRKANDPKALLNAKLFFEAFLGFYKTYNAK